MNRSRPRTPARWVTGLILFTTAGLTALFLVDRSPTRTLQRLGFSDEGISKIRNRAKRTYFLWSFDADHPSFHQATFNDGTNHVVPREVVENIRDFVRQAAREDCGYSTQFAPLRRCQFKNYGAAVVVELPDQKHLYLHRVYRPYSTSILLQVHDPETGKAGEQPHTVSTGHLKPGDLSVHPHDDRSLFTTRELRSQGSYTIGIRSVSHNGTDDSQRYYTYYRIDEDLNLMPILSQLQGAYVFSGKWVESDINTNGLGGILMRYRLRRASEREFYSDVGWKRFEWNRHSNAFELVESKRTIDTSDTSLNSILNRHVFPELAPKDKKPRTSETPMMFPSL